MIPAGLSGYAGELCIIIALTMALWQSRYLFSDADTLDASSTHVTLKKIVTTQCLAITLAFIWLMTAYLISDFSLLNVWQNSNTAMPWYYRLTASWGNHEGSMLLWVWVLSLFGMVAGRQPHEARIQTRMLATHGAVMLGMLAFIWLTSNPFALLPGIPDEGNDLNPLLQDIGLILHPPMLYLGYVGCGIIFLYAIAAMWLRDIPADLARLIHPWIALSWSLLTAGIGLGSWWAYRELGWGGWWFWDPVENVSLLPWFCLTALMHANRMYMRYQTQQSWVLFLCILAFAMSLVGTFIVRSGLLVSVHSFATDPERGVLILLYITLVIGSGLWLFARTHSQPSKQTGFWSRHGFIQLNNVLLMASLATVLLAIIYPLLMPLFNLPGITVGPPYYNKTVLPMMAALVLLAGIAPWLGALRSSIKKLLLRLGVPLVIALSGALLLAFYIESDMTLTLIGSALGLWLLASSALYGWRLYSSNKTLRAQDLPLLFGHVGLAFMTLAVTFNSLHSMKAQEILSTGDTVQFAGYDIRFLSERMDSVHNYGYREAVLNFGKGDKNFTLTPEVRYYLARQMHTSEAAIDSNLWRDIYVTATLQDDAKKLGFNFYYKPAMNMLWMSFALLSLAGMLSARILIKKNNA